MAKVQTGTVKWFNNKLGFGFIIPDADPRTVNPDVIVHHTVIEMQGFRTLVEGARVRFTEEFGDKGRAATWVSTEMEPTSQRFFDLETRTPYFGG
jgi:cold shock protein